MYARGATRAWPTHRCARLAAGQGRPATAPWRSRAPRSCSAAARRRSSLALLTCTRRLVGADTLAQLVLLYPPGFDDDVEVVARDGHRSEQSRLQLELLLATTPFRRLLDRLARSQCDRRVGCFFSELARILPNRDGLRAECDAVERRMVRVLSRHRNAADALRR